MIVKKAISPVVATALLLVVAVVSVSSFQGWFDSFQSGVNADVERKSDISSMRTGVDVLVGSIVYFYNGESNNLTINELKVGNNTCNISNSVMEPGINEIDLSSCLLGIPAGSAKDVVVVTDKGVLMKTVLVNYPSSLDCSLLETGDWVKVPGSSYFGTNDFCVMKWEAKQDSSGLCLGGPTDNCPVSQSDGFAWTSINFTDAYLKCSQLGEGYHLMTNREWMTIARNIEYNPNNWADKTVGSNYTSGGGLFVGNSGAIDGTYWNHSCYDSILDGNTPGSNCILNNDFHTDRNKRTLELSNGEIIWDLSGNVWQWVDAMEDGGFVTVGNPCQGSEWYSYFEGDGSSVCSFLNGYAKTDAVDKRFEVGPLGNHNADNGVGRILANSGTVRAFYRGGWNDGKDVGVFALSLLIGPSVGGVYGGFRCAYAP
jgi:hypothetical protein